MNDEQVAKWKKWQSDLEGETFKVKKKDVAKLLKSKVKEEHQEPGDYVIVGTNYLGREIVIKCKTKEECYASLATYNGITIK